MSNLDKFTVQLLVVEADPGELARIQEQLSMQSGAVVTEAGSLQDAGTEMARGSFDVVLLGLGGPAGWGLVELDYVSAAAERLPLIVLTESAPGGTADADELIAHGATECLPREAISSGLLWRSLRMLLEHDRFLQMVGRLHGFAGTAFWSWNGHGAAIACSKAAGSLVGLDTSDGTFDFKSLLRKIHTPDRSRLFDILGRIRASLGGEEIFEFRLVSDDGPEKDLRLLIRQQAGLAGQRAGLEGICQDVTGRNSLRRIQEEMISVVSHELRTPLTAMRGALGLIVGLEGDQLSPRHRRLVEIAQDNCQRMQGLINNLLDLDRISRGAMRLARRNISLRTVLESVLQQEQEFASQSAIALDLVLEEGDIICHADPERLRTMLCELVVNGIKFSPPGSKVRLRVRSLGGLAQILVEDHGSGIAPELGDGVFEPFVQGDRSARRSREGGGLGLTVVRRLAALQGGDCRFHSPADGGTVFELELPVCRCGATPQAVDEERNGPLEGWRSAPLVSA